MQNTVVLTGKRLVNPNGRKHMFYMVNVKHVSLSRRSLLIANIAFIKEKTMNESSLS